MIPARDLHPLGERSPQMVSWLSARRRAGDSIAQHGFRHEQLRRGELSRQTLAHAHGRRAAAEFVGLDGEETRRAVNAGWRLLKLAGVEPDGFVAPAYAYTPALRQALAPKFRWWAGLLRLHGMRADPPHEDDAREPLSPTWLAPTWSLASDNPLRRPLSPALIRVGSMLSAHTLRLDLYPSDLRRRRQMRALEQALGRAGHRRRAITYDEITATSPQG